MIVKSIDIAIVIEQPKLHLHSALQAKLIDIIAKAAKEEKVNFIIETHSVQLFLVFVKTC